jgi:hypothetical protein
MRSLAWYLLVLVLTAGVPLAAPAPRTTGIEAQAFPGWPALQAGPALPELALSEAERGFAESFPGKIAKFGDSRRTFVVRWITAATRRLHPAEDCYRASGFAIHHQVRCPSELEGGLNCFVAERGSVHLAVGERITDQEGRAFTDVSAWYWAAMRGTSRGPWWSITTSVRMP